MNTTFYNGVSGMVAYQQDMDVIAHNMANVNTHGFKGSRTAFSDILYTKMAVNGFEEGKEPLSGHGVKTVATDLNMKQGNLLTTGYNLDYAITGEGFFSVQKGEQRYYTRNGAFTMSIEGDKAMLVSTDGGYILDSTGKPIEVPKKKDSEEHDYTAVMNMLGVYQFDNPSGLSQTDASRFMESTNSGTAKVIKPTGDNKGRSYKIVPGALETSGVDIAETMANVIMTQRAFQMNAKMVQTGDQIDEVITGLR